MFNNVIDFMELKALIDHLYTSALTGTSTVVLAARQPMVLGEMIAMMATLSNSRSPIEFRDSGRQSFILDVS